MLEIKNVSKTYKPKKGVPVKALDDVSLKFEDTGMVFILGKSGSGKSTLLNVLGGLDAADKGEFIIKGKSSKNFSQSDFDSYRNTFVGFIFQEYNILPEFTVKANIALAIELQGKKATEAEIAAILDEVDLVGYSDRKPNELSGGQKQRVAIARALVKSPEIIMADEPTGALDSKTGKQVFDTLKKLSKSKLVLVVSHDREFAEQYADRIIELSDGKILSDVSKAQIQPTSVSEGISVIDGNILHIKKGYSLRPDDLALINEYISKAEEDTFVSTDAKSNSDLKRFAGISDDGAKDTFKNTETVELKEYTEKDRKFIRSRLPFKNSFKIGASSLKSKPIRLVFTIFLCLVAFTLFGISDTAGSYDKKTVLLQSINDSQISFASFSKSYVVQNGLSSHETSYKLTDEDIETIKSESGVNVIPVYGGRDNWDTGFSFTNMLEDQSKLASSSGYNFYMGKFAGYAELDESILTENGFELTGALPNSDNEIAITKYIYDHFEIAGLRYYDPISKDIKDLTADKINSFEDVIGKTVVLSNQASFPSGNSSSNQGMIMPYGNETQVKIVGIIDTRLSLNEKYSSFMPASDKTPSTDTGFLGMVNYEELRQTLMYSYDNLVAVNKGMLKKIVAEGNKYKNYDNVTIGKFNRNTFITLISDTNAYVAEHVATLSEIKPYISIQWTDGEKTALADNEVIVKREPNYMSYESSSGIKSNTITALINAGYNFNNDEKEMLKKTSISNFSIDNYFNSVYLANLKPTDVPASFKKYVSSFEMYGDNMPDQEYLNLYKSYLSSDMFFNGNEGGIFENAFGEKSGKAYYYEFLEILYDAENIKSNIAEVGTYNIYGNLSEEIDVTEYKIVGYYMPKANYPDSALPCVISDRIYNAIDEPKEGSYLFALGKMPLGNDVAVADIIDFSERETNHIRYHLNSGASYILENVEEFLIPLSDIFLYVGIFFALFAALMMFNFISVSISYKKREIGILRAVGAKSSDVFGIFFNESLIITLINFVLSSVATAAIVNLLNYFLRTEFGLVITILNVGIRQILLILGVGLLVAFIGSFIPVMRIARKKPIDAIQNR